MLSKESISILSTIINFLLAVLKLTVGFIVHSAGLIADGIHSGLDIASSFVTFLGIKAAKKPADKEHPYGHARSETIAGFIVTFLLLISAIWIIYEGVISIIKKQSHPIGSIALVVVVISIVVNEIMARIKFKIGQKQNNLALIADAQHSRADSISSAAVLVGLFLTRFYPQADGITAIIVGLYILYETYLLSKQIVDDLLDVANPQVEEKIKKICAEQEIKLKTVKTRKIGPQVSAELQIALDKQWRMEKVDEIIRNLQKVLIKKIQTLKFAIIQVVSHDIERGYIKSTFGHIKDLEKEEPKVNLPKRGFRTIIPIQAGKLYNAFGAPEYLVIDRDNKKIIQKKIIKNSYFVIGRGHGMRFARAIEANQVITPEIGPNAKQGFKEMGVKVKIVSPGTKLEEIIKKL